MKSRAQKKFVLGVLIGAVFGSMTLMAAVVIFFLYFLFGGPAEVTTDVSQYEYLIGGAKKAKQEKISQEEVDQEKTGQEEVDQEESKQEKISQEDDGQEEAGQERTEREGVLTRHSNIRSGFVVFPDRLLCGEEDTEFYYFYQDTWDDPTVQVYLKCQYDEETYAAEITRLKSLTKLRYEDSDRFPFPAYMAINGAGCSYEYALAGSDRQMIYIFTSYVHEDKIAFDKQYLPKDYEDIFIQDYKEYMDAEHTIYLEKTSYGLDGKPDGWGFNYDIDGK